jgi:hypothetical protein
MADIGKCEICRFSCKGITDKCRKFFPQEAFLGSKLHFREDDGKHDKTSHMCVVCKNYFHYSKIRWIRLSKGYYPMCLGNIELGII